ncbi:MAG TPA: MFS transporter [Acidimicrobiales bacterium]|jgi:MFS family permease
MAPDGWRSLPPPRQGAEAFEVTPFGRLARAHATAVAGDTLVTIALAGTLFFSIDVAEARGEVFLYLALTMAPFAVVAPLVGPALDRAAGGRRWMVIASSGLRALVCLLMVDHVDSLLLFPLAFLLLVLAKSYHVAKSALVPTVVHSHEGLVEANSKLSLISGIVGFIAAVPGGLLLRVGGSEWVLALAAVVFAVGAGVSWRIPKLQVADEPESSEAKAELRGAGVLLAASAMALLRGIVGFLTFLLAFALRTDGSPTWHFGVVIALSGIGSFLGAAVAPPLRRQTSEEHIISGSLVLVAVLAVAGTWIGSLPGSAVVALSVGIGAACAKQAFDSIVQRDAPDANRGRSFARFETRFQLVWVGGAILGVVPMPTWLGFLLVAGTSAFAGISYAAGSRGVRDVDQRWTRRRARRAGAAGGSEVDPTTTMPSVPPTIAIPGRARPVEDPTIVEDQ